VAFGSIDLTTEDGALGATGLASLACFIAAGLSVLGAWFTWGMSSLLVPGTLTALLIAAAIETVVFLIAGFRFRLGKGVVWGFGAGALLAIEIVLKFGAASRTGAIIDVGLLVLVANGVRAALALRRGFVDADAQAEIFS